MNLWNKEQDEYLRRYFKDTTLNKDEREQLFEDKLYPVMVNMATSMIKSNRHAWGLITNGYDIQDFIQIMISKVIQFFYDKPNLEPSGGLVYNTMLFALQTYYGYQFRSNRNLIISDEVLFKDTEETGSLNDLISYQAWSSASSSILKDKEFVNYMLDWWMVHNTGHGKKASRIIYDVCLNAKSIFNGTSDNDNLYEPYNTHAALTVRQLKELNKPIIDTYINTGILPAK